MDCVALEEAFFYNELQNTVHEQLNKLTMRTIGDILNTWVRKDYFIYQNMLEGERLISFIRTTPLRISIRHRRALTTFHQTSAISPPRCPSIQKHLRLARSSIRNRYITHEILLVNHLTALASSIGGMSNSFPNPKHGSLVGFSLYMMTFNRRQPYFMGPKIWWFMFITQHSNKR